jgi:hypothetical protein
MERTLHPLRTAPGAHLARTLRIPHHAHLCQPVPIEPALSVL